MIGSRTTSVGALIAPLALTAIAHAAPAKPHVVMVLPFDASALSTEDRWLGAGAAEIVTLGLAQHPRFVRIEQSRVRAFGTPEVWGDATVLQAARALKADAALFGRIARNEGNLVIQPRVLELKSGGSDTVNLEPMTAPPAEVLARLGALPTAFVKTLRVAVTEPENARMEKAARPTPSMRAFELYTRAKLAMARGGQEANETAVDLLSRAIEADPNFFVAQYTLGVVHQTLGNRWKAGAQFRAATQLDPTQPEPLKALGDLFLAAPRRLFDQAVEAYTKAIELRPFYADAHVGLGEAKAAKGDIDGAVAAFQKALVYDPVNPRVYLALGKIYYSEKGLFYESVSAYKHAIELDPQSVEARMGLGDVYDDKGLYKEAITQYAKVIELDDKNTTALYNLALVHEKTDPREAIAEWERYIELASQLPSEKDWVDVARQHLRKLRNQVKD